MRSWLSKIGHRHLRSGLVLLAGLCLFAGLYPAFCPPLHQGDAEVWSEVHGWESTPGELTDGIGTHLGWPIYEPVAYLHYRFEVNGRTYSSSCLRVLDTISICGSASDDFTARFWGLTPGTLVVYYDPDEPGRSTPSLLDDEKNRPKYLALSAALFLALVPGLAVLLLGLAYRLGHSRQQTVEPPGWDRTLPKGTPWSTLPLFLTILGANACLSVLYFTISAPALVGCLVVAGLILPVARLALSWVEGWVHRLVAG